jgi:putative tryptophan/tyrosine transport system substrate-binding protein
MHSGKGSRSSAGCRAKTFGSTLVGLAGYLAAITPAAPTFGVELTITAVRNTTDIERGIDAVAGTSDGGIIVLPGPAPSSRRDRIIALAEQHRLPAVYPFRYWVLSGGLASYGIDNIELYRLAASYVDRILKGEKPADLPGSST